MPVGGDGPLTGASSGSSPYSPFSQDPDSSYNKDPDQFITIPAGISQIGEGDHKHIIEVNSFEIGKYPVTNRNYQRFLIQSGHKSPPYWKNDLPDSFNDHPVVDISWFDALAYCNWLSGISNRKYRLPTDVEWERSSRGEQNFIYPWGNSFSAENCNCWEIGVGWTTPVNCFSKGASKYGVLDMVGNVWEWCSSLYAEYPYQVSDGREDLTASGWRVLRGGSWMDHEWGVRAARRLSGNPESISHNTGFRVVRELSL